MSIYCIHQLKDNQFGLKRKTQYQSHAAFHKKRLKWKNRKVSQSILKKPKQSNLKMTKRPY